MVDFDGTITEKGVNQIDPEIVKEFARLLKTDFPVAICTGRQLDSFKRRIKPLHEYLEKHRLLSKLKNLYLIAENGAIGYYYDPTTKRYKIFHKADWPKDFPKKKQLLIYRYRQPKDCRPKSPQRAPRCRLFFYDKTEQ